MPSPAFTIIRADRRREREEDHISGFPPLVRQKTELTHRGVLRLCEPRATRPSKKSRERADEHAEIAPANASVSPRLALMCSEVAPPQAKVAGLTVEGVSSLVRCVWFSQAEKKNARGIVPGVAPLSAKVRHATPATASVGPT